MRALQVQQGLTMQLTCASMGRRASSQLTFSAARRLPRQLSPFPASQPSLTTCTPWKLCERRRSRQTCCCGDPHAKTPRHGALDRASQGDREGFTDLDLAATGGPRHCKISNGPTPDILLGDPLRQNFSSLGPQQCFRRGRMGLHRFGSGSKRWPLLLNDEAGFASCCASWQHTTLIATEKDPTNYAAAEALTLDLLVTGGPLGLHNGTMTALQVWL